MHTRAIESLIAVVGVQVFAAIAVMSLHRSEAWLRRALPYVISVAVGVLLATGVVHLLPEAVAKKRRVAWCYDSQIDEAATTGIAEFCRRFEGRERIWANAAWRAQGL